MDGERLTLPRDRLVEAYGAFDSHNTTLKSIVTAWQLKDPDTPNDHKDAHYDAGIVIRLAPAARRTTPRSRGLPPWARALAPDSRDLALPELFAAVRAAERGLAHEVR